MRRRPPPPRARAAAAGVVVVAVLVAAGPAAAADARPLPHARPSQELAMLGTAHQAFRTLGGPRSPLGLVQASQPLTGVGTVLPVLAHGSRGGVGWLRVMLPGRPNGRTGWIRRQGTVPTTTSWHLVVRLARRQVLVFRAGRLVRRLPAVVGKPATPTPAGRFYVEESVRMLPGSAGAPYALALSARSNVLQEFEGGPGQIALHGVRGLDGPLGTAVSHGCVRLSDGAISWLAGRIVPGVPVDIEP